MTEKERFKPGEIAANYLQGLTRLIDDLDLTSLENVLNRLRTARNEGSFVYVAGNGGSAATAMHWVNDLGKATKRSGCTPMRVMSLGDNLSWLTALANDEGYERVFAGQLENFASPKDVLVVISASGNSLNLVRAVELAKKNKMVTIGFLGFDGGILKKMVDEFLWIPSKKGDYELVEDCHMILCNILTQCLMKER